MYFTRTLKAYILQVLLFVCASKAYYSRHGIPITKILLKNIFFLERSDAEGTRAGEKRLGIGTTELRKKFGDQAHKM